MKEIVKKHNKKLFSIISYLQTHYHVKLDFQKWTYIQEASGQSTAPYTARTISRKAENSPVEYPSRESKRRYYVQFNIQRKRPGVETSREVSSWRTRTT